jgi:DNA repair exonuclease SbcCD ATPase subunit
LINEIQLARNAVKQYEIKYQMYLVQKREKEAALEKLKEYPEDLEEMLGYADAAYSLALTFETNMANYSKAKDAYDKALAELQGLKDELEDWTKGRNAVADLRVKVKGYLLPSLNAVASKLINEMTGGELSWIVVNDQFEITVEGQRLETLSGAGKAVANLALRIALGQVLTNRVFSVMMLDEIDASCDEDRAKYIATCLKNLTKSIKQVIQVSHKTGLVADHYVRL